MILSAIVVVGLVWPAVVQGQAAAPQCEQKLQLCLNTTETDMQRALSAFNLTSVCSSLQSAAACYNTSMADPLCVNFTGALKLLISTNQQNLLKYCPGGQPSPCLLSLKVCYNDYRQAVPPSPSSPSSLPAVCRAVDKANSCVDRLMSNATLCPTPLQSVLAGFEEKVTRDISISDCAKNDTNATQCQVDAATCLAPIENQLKRMSSSFDFTGICGEWPKIQSCITQLQGDSRCSSDQKQDLLAKMGVLTNKYHQYCDNNNQPIACLTTVQSCTSTYTTASTNPMFTKDKLYMCKATENLMTCLTPLQQNASSCPPLKSVQAIASLTQTEALITQECGTILSACTSTAAQCILDKDARIDTAQELGQYDKMCTLAADFKKCLDPYLSQDSCRNNQYLAFETTYINNITTIVCQPNDPTQAKPCLHRLSQCAAPFVNVIENNITLVCSAQKTFVSCIDQITCPGQGLESQLQSFRAMAQREECGATNNAAATHGKAAVFYVTLTLLATGVLRSWA